MAGEEAWTTAFSLDLISQHYIRERSKWQKKLAQKGQLYIELYIKKWFMQTIYLGLKPFPFNSREQNMKNTEYAEKLPIRFLVPQSIPNRLIYILFA